MTLILLKDGKKVYVSEDRHFEDIIREYLGNNAVEYLRERIKQTDDLEGEVCELESKLESASDDWDILNDKVGSLNVEIAELNKKIAELEKKSGDNK